MNLRLRVHENVGLLHSNAGNYAGLGGKQGLLSSSATEE